MSENDMNSNQNSSKPVYPYGNQNYSGYPRYEYKRKEQDEILKHASSKTAFVALILCWVYGILFTEIFIKGGFGLSIPLLVSIFYLIVAWYFSKKDVKPLKGAYSLLVPIGLISLGYVITDNGTTYFINTLLLITLVPLQLTRMSGTSAGPLFSLQSIFNTLVGTVGQPLAYLDTPFKAISENAKKSSKGSKGLLILAGLAIALPITIIFLALFVQADQAFKFIINELVSSIDISIDGLLIDMLFGSIIAILLASWLITLRARKVPENKDIKIKFGLNNIIVSTFLIVINFVQLTFVIVQFSYLFAKMELPKLENMTYAEYARSGFFELCAAIAVSVLIIMICMIFVRKSSNHKLPAFISGLLTLLIACNYVVATSAIMRMLSYINVYDLSVKRCMVTWLITVFVLCMAGALIKIWRPSFHAASYVAIVVIAMTILINYINVNGLVAQYNVNNYLNSYNTADVRKIDVRYLGSLGPSAAQSTAKLIDKYDRDAIIQVLNIQKYKLNQKSWKNFSLVDLEAERVFKNYSIEGNIENYNYDRYGEYYIDDNIER